MDKKKEEIQRKYREQMRGKTEHDEDASSHTFEIVVVLAIIILVFFFNSVFKAF
ncbi:hypothetical protein C6370_00135 [Bacillus atrophaeus]|uniref:hypothetical protein n=1 Tax=Bacillus atrophaeus TaxID=1452 RepID=UPI000D08517B|nr:hypothetical protein [Bacillus atrophaeus]PSA95826.1 hypothetical protein C6370_00135 [Bacillus atrophaeus]